MSNHDIVVIAGYLKVFSNPLRLRIIYSLHDSEKTVTEIVTTLAEKQCTVSTQLKILLDHDIIKRRREKKYVYYDIKDRHVSHLLEMVKAGLGNHLD